VNEILCKGEQDMFKIVFQKICTAMICEGELVLDSWMLNVGWRIWV